jgi:uncharacterized protein (DUF58 family)
MRGSRRFQGLVATSGLLVVLSALAERPILLAGGLGTAALLVVLQLRFLRQLQRLDARLAIDLSVGRTNVQTDGTEPLTLSVAGAETPVPLTFTAAIPPSITAEESPILRLDRSERDGRVTTTLTFPVAGTSTIDGVEIAASDRYGLFRETFTRGKPVTITVEPPRPRTVHVGQGGERTVSTLGEHRSGQLGQGTDPAEIREYVPGDTVSDIDWKATARLGEPHVREYEVETDRRTILFVDHRHGLATGPSGESMLAYLQEVALTLTAAARDLDDPLGLYAVGDEGTTVEVGPSTNARQYEQIRTRVLDLEPTPAREHEARTAIVGPAGATRRAARLDGSTAFEGTLRPYFDSRGQYLTRLTEKPLFRTVKTQRAHLEGSVWSVILTDDANRAELRETVRLARRGPGHVLVFVTPRVLFEPGGLSDLEDAYERYHEFEEFRRDLDRLDGVTVYEVGPADRIDALLAARRGETR